VLLLLLLILLLILILLPALAPPQNHDKQAPPRLNFHRFEQKEGCWP
jgi:hypothetical protein